MTDQRKLYQTLCDGLPHGLNMGTLQFPDNNYDIKYFSIEENDIWCECDLGNSTHTRWAFREFIKGDALKPILFSLDSLTEEITINGETFVPIDRLIQLAKLPGTLQFLKWIKETGTSGVDWSELNNWIIEWLDEHHFNRRGLSPDQFINVKDLEQNPYH